jgi:hypothetical protein
MKKAEAWCGAVGSRSFRSTSLLSQEWRNVLGLASLQWGGKRGRSGGGRGTARWRCGAGFSDGIMAERSRGARNHLEQTTWMDWEASRSNQTRGPPSTMAAAAPNFCRCGHAL